MRLRPPRIRMVCMAAIAILNMLLISGCWDRSEIEERAVVLAIAVDVAQDDSKNGIEEISYIKGITPLPPESKVRVTAQIAVPGRIPLGPGEGTGGGKRPVWVLEAVGHSVNDAMTVLQQEVADRLFLGHLRVIVISEEYARSGMGNLNDYLRRNPEVRRLAWLLVSKGEASKLMEAAPELERVPALYLLSTMDHAVEMGKYPNEFIGNFWIKMSSQGREANLPYIETKKKDNVQISGLAYFKGDRMIGVTEPLEIGFYMGLTGVSEGGYTAFVQLPGSEETALFKATNRRTNIEVGLQEGRPHVNVNVILEGNITEKSQDEAASVSNDRIISELSERLSQDLVKSQKQFIANMQAEGSDIFGFGEYFRAKEPQYWNHEIRDKETWQENFKEIAIDLDVQVYIRRVGSKAE